MIDKARTSLSELRGELQVRLDAEGVEWTPGRLACLLSSVNAPGGGLIVCLAGLFTGGYRSSNSSADLARAPTETAVEHAARVYLAWSGFRDEIERERAAPGVAERIAAMRSTGFCRFHGRTRPRGGGGGGGDAATAAAPAPVCWLRPALHRIDEHPHATSILYHDLVEEGAALTDAAAAAVGAPLGGSFSVVYDRAGLGLWQGRRNAAQCRALIAQHAETAEVFVRMYYSRVGGDVYIVNAGLLFWACYQLCSPLLPAEMRSRLSVLRSPGDLCEHIDPAQMPPVYAAQMGGGSRLSSSSTAAAAAAAAAQNDRSNPGKHN